jgi:hypothetical protein
MLTVAPSRLPGAPLVIQGGNQKREILQWQ